jgi:hypothetical protein
MSNKVMQFEGDIRMWQVDATTRVKTPVNAAIDDVFGNTPVEASAAIFSYTAGDTRQVVSKRRDRYNQPIFSDQDPGASGISLTLVAIPPMILARMFYGDAAETSVSTGSATAEAISADDTTVTTPIQLSHKYVKASPAPVVKKDSDTLIEGTDYTLDLRRGLVIPKSGGAIVAGDDLAVDYSYTGYELISIRGGVKPTENFYITGDMLNRPDKSDLSIEIDQANLSNDGDVDLFSADPITVTLKGTLVTIEGATEPYRTKQYTPAAS